MNNFIKKIQSQTNLSAQEAWWLLQHVTNKSQAELMFYDQLSNTEQEELDQAIIQLNDQHKPLAYIIGFVPFLDIKIQVQPPILIPRTETEDWVLKIIEKFKPFQNQIKSICDLGTGSGCIALALAKNFPAAHVTAVDINQQALQLTQKNAILNNIKNITFIHSDLFKKISNDTKFDLIVSNPPYIDPKHLNTLTKQVTAWEDHQALFAQDSGLKIITQILQNSAQFLQKNNAFPGQLIFEIDHDQHEQVIKIAQNFGWSAHALQDNFSKWRTIWCSIKKC